MTDDSRSMAGLFTRNRHLLILSVVMILVAGSSAPSVKATASAGS